MDNTCNCTTVNDFFDGLREALPPVFTRKVACEMTGGLFTVRGLANIDSAGKGPSKKLMSGKSVLYEREDFIDWLETTIRPKKEIKNSQK